MNLTLGAELEWADVDTRIPFPPELGWWDKDEVNIVNSDGTANWHTPFGGEVCLSPRGSIEESVLIMLQLKRIYNPTINYRSGVHIHIAYDGLAQDLDAQKKLLAYILANQAYVNEHVYVVDPGETKEERRYARGLRNWGQMVPKPDRVEEMMAATTPDEFYQGHYAPTKNGGRNYALTPRSYVNLRSLHKHGTVEFRHFYGTADGHQFRSMLQYCETFLRQALGERRPVSEWFLEGLMDRDWSFPGMEPFSAELEASWRETKRG